MRAPDMIRFEGDLELDDGAVVRDPGEASLPSM